MATDSKWIKGIIRKGDVLFALCRYSEAVEAYSTALQIAPMNELVHEKIEQARRSAMRSDPALSTDYDDLNDEGVELDLDRPLSLLEKLQMVFRVLLLLFFSLVILLPSHRWELYRLGLLCSAAVYSVILYRRYGTPRLLQEYSNKLKADWNTW